MSNFSVRLIASTKAVAENIADFSAEELTSYIARVSNPSNQMSAETAPKLLGYCIKNKHWSVFEHVNMTVEIKTSRGIAAQILRHRSFVFQEFSQRYATAINNCIYPARRQDVKNRQNSIDDLPTDDCEWFKMAQERIWLQSRALYEEALSRGIAKEQSRFLLPLSTETTLYMTGNLRCWIHYLQLRTEAGTQKEHRDIAEGIRKIFVNEFPQISKALEWAV